MRRVSTTGLAGMRATAWAHRAERIRARFERRADVFGIALRLYARRGRTVAMIEQRWLSPVLRLEAQLHWLSNTAAATTYSRISQVFLRQISFFSTAQAALQPAAKPEMVFPQMIPRPSAEDRNPPAARRLESTSREFTLKLERRFTERQSSISLHTTERLTHRLERMERNVVLDRTMTFHRESQSTLKSTVETTVARRFEQQQGLSSPPLAMPATSPVINVEQLADQVIRQIDRRVLARKERLGRI